MSSKKPNSPPPPHQHFSPPPYDIVHNKLNEVKEDTVIDTVVDTVHKKAKIYNPNIPNKPITHSIHSSQTNISPHHTHSLNPYIDETKQEETFVKKKLLYHLKTRPERQKLVNLNILRAFDQDPSLRAVMDNLMKQRLRMLLSSRILDKKLSNRKSIQSLIREGILKEADDGSDEEEEEQKGNRRDMYRRMSNHSLTEFLSRRPTLQELVKANMVQDVMTWTKIACSGTTPRARNCHQMCLNADDTALYLVGGFNTGSVSIDLLKFDIQNSVWSRPLVGGPVPPERYCHTVCNIDSNLVVFGGFSVEGKWLNDLHALDTEYAMNSEFKAFVPRLSAYGQCKASTNNNQMLLWYPPETTGDPPSPRAAHAACVVGKNMYIFGGNNYNKLFNDLHCLDTSNMKWAQVITQGKAPSPRANHSLTAIGDKYLIVFGGNDGQPLNDIHIFDIENNTWTEPKMHGTPPIARGGHSAVRIKHKQLLIFGGGYNSKILNDLNILDVETMTWIRPSDTGMLPQPRAGHSCCVTKNNVVYICGGGDSENDKLFNDLYQLDTGYFTTDEKQISKLIYNKPKDKHHNKTGSGHIKKENISKLNITPQSQSQSQSHSYPRPRQRKVDAHAHQTSYTMSRSSYEYNNGNFSQSNFKSHVQHFIANNDEQYGGGAQNSVFNRHMNEMNMSPLMQAGMISDDITNVSQEIDCIIQSVENGIKGKINEFRQKEQGYIMILRSIEAERTKLIDDVNRDITMLKFSVKESLDKLQQKFIAKMLKKHVDYVSDNPNYGNPNYGYPHHAHAHPHPQQPVHNQNNKKPAKKSKTTLMQSPLMSPSLGTIQEEPQNKDSNNNNNKEDKIKISAEEPPNNNNSENNIINPIGQSPKILSLKHEETKDNNNNTQIQKTNKNKKKKKKKNKNGENNTQPQACAQSPVMNSCQSQSPLPLSNKSQSPNPTLAPNSALQQSQMGLIKPPNTMINAALTQQAEFQKHQMMARHFVKVQELQRQQKLQQFQAQQLNILAMQQQQQQHNHPQHNSTSPQPQPQPQNWWQRGQQQPYSLNQHMYHPSQSQSQNGVQIQPKKAKKKRRKKKKRKKKTQQHTNTQMEGNLNNVQNVANISPIMNNNMVFHPSHPPPNGMHTHPLPHQHGHPHPHPHAQYQYNEYNHNPNPSFVVASNQMKSSLNPNAMSFK